MFFKKKEKFKVIKVYVLDEDQETIERAMLVNSILNLFESNLETPKDFDIGGPYGIRKGASCGVKAFKNKLEKKGHNDYYALSGITENDLGFEFLVDAIYKAHKYSELIIWFNPKKFELSFEMLIRKFLVNCKISYAYEIELDSGFSIKSETKIKKGIFGGLSVTSSYENIKWIENFTVGEYREIYKWNFMSFAQLSKARKTSAKLNVKQIEDMYLVESGT